MRIRIVLALLFAFILSGCVGTPDSEGWRSSQKSEFLKILETDKYMSICDQQALYAKVKQSRNSQLMSKLLIAYSENLANGCIVDSAGGYKQTVSSSDIRMQIKAGQSIEKILKPYVPEYKQFNELIAKYKLVEDPASKRKIRMNIERVKMLKPGLGKTYALVNIPEYIIRVIEKDKESVNMRVVVGTNKNQTPIFSADLHYA
jgi:hypothetical protein